LVYISDTRPEPAPSGSVADYPLTPRHPDGILIDVLYRASVFAETRLDPGR